MKPTQEQLKELGIALNETTLINLRVDQQTRIADATLSVMALPLEGPPPDDRRLRLLLYPVGRVAVSLRLGVWNDSEAQVQPLDIDELSHIIESIQTEIYGWEFFDLDEDFAKWSDRLSLDLELGEDGREHSITLFQEDGLSRHLDVRIWFDELAFNDPAGHVVDIDDVSAGGRRWWEALFNGDPRTHGSGIVPLARTEDR